MGKKSKSMEGIRETKYVFQSKIQKIQGSDGAEHVEISIDWVRIDIITKEVGDSAARIAI